MAKKKERKTAPSRRKGGLLFFCIMIIVGAIVPFGLPTLLLCLGLLPTLVALITDTDPKKSAAAAIGFLNVAGVAPFILELWEKGQTMENAMQIVLDSTTWLIMLGAAALGQLLIYAVPPVVASMTLMKLEARLRLLRDGLSQLKEIWGPDVATHKAVDQVQKGDAA